MYIVYIIYTLCFHPNHKVINKLFHMSGVKFQNYFTIFILRNRVEHFGGVRSPKEYLHV